MVTRLTFTLVAAVALLAANVAVARSVYLNGIDISSSRNQNLKGVNLRIDENGNLYVEAPHYQVNEENTFAPLSSWIQGTTGPKHQVPQELPKTLSSPADMQKLPPVVDPEPVSKAGTPEAQAPVENQQPEMQNKGGTKTTGG